MNGKNRIDILKEEIEIPEIVMNKAEEAFSRIRSEAWDMPQAEADNKNGRIRRQSAAQDPAAERCAESDNRALRRIRRPGRRRLAAVGLAAVLVLGTVTAGAAAYLNWSSSLERGLQVSQEQKDAAESSGLADFPELSVTDAGVTVTALQSITDNYFSYLSFKVEGYGVPEGVQPGFESTVVTVDGEEVSYVGGFYNGLITGEDGRAKRDDGEEIPVDEDGSLVMDYSLEDGSLEYRITLYPLGEQGDFLDRSIHVGFTGLGIYSDEKATESVQVDVQGNWSFEWTLKGDDSTYAGQCSEPVGDTEAVLTEVEISPISIKAVLEFPRQEMTEIGYRESQVLEDGELKQVSEPFEFTTYVEPPYLMGVKLKDGTLLPRLSSGSGREGYIDEESDRYEQLFSTNQIIDVEQVQSLLFLKEAPEGEGGILTEDNLYVVDIR